MIEDLGSSGGRIWDSGFRIISGIGFRDPGLAVALLEILNPKSYRS